MLRRLDHLCMDSVKVRAYLMTIDEPALISDLLQGAAVRGGSPDVKRYDRLVDATGVARPIPAAHRRGAP